MADLNMFKGTFSDVVDRMILCICVTVHYGAKNLSSFFFFFFFLISVDHCISCIVKQINSDFDLKTKALTALVSRLSLSVGWENCTERGLTNCFI